MNLQLVFVFCVLAIAIVALARDAMRPGLILLSASVVLMVGGTITPKEMLEGFSNKGMITVAMLYLVSEGVRRSVVLGKLIKLLLPSGKTTVRRMQFRMLPTVAFCSAFLNNTPVVVIFAPIIKRWAERLRIPSTKFLIPLSYATILGGMCTLIGTSTNLVVDGLVQDAGFKGFAMFELLKVGGFIAVAGIAYLVIFSTWLLPDERISDDDISEDEAKGRLQRVEVVIGPRFSAIGRCIREFDFRHKFDATILEMRRNGRTILMHDLRNERFREGDTLVVLTDSHFVDTWGESSFFLIVNGQKETEPAMPQWKRITSVVLLVLMIAGATVGELPVVREAFPRAHFDMFFFATVVTIAMAWLRIYPVRKYTKFISWDILITIASAFAISKAMMNSGVADTIADFAIGLTTQYGPVVLLAFIFIVTDLFTELMTNNAAAALAFPISLSIAQHLGVSPMPFFVTICMAASSSFSTPIGYQTNLIVQNVGGYRFSDFLRVGLPLNLIAFVLSVLLIPLIWPF